jgi:hypothetical protein
MENEMLFYLALKEDTELVYGYDNSHERETRISFFYKGDCPIEYYSIEDALEAIYNAAEETHHSVEDIIVISKSN